MNELNVLLGQRAELSKQLVEWQRKLSEAKWGKRRDEKKNINIVEKQIKELDKKIKELQKYSYLNNGVDAGMDLQSNKITAIGGAISSSLTAAGSAVGSATGGGLLGEFGLKGRGAARMTEAEEKTKRAAMDGTPTTASSWFSGNNLYIVIGAAILFLFLFMRKK